MSRAALAAATGLTKATASALAADLLDRGLVSEQDPVHDGRMGRPAALLSIAADRVGAIGLQVEVDHLTAAVVDLSGTVRSRRVTSRSGGPEEVIDRLEALAAGARADAADAAVMCTGVGLAIPGLVDPRSAEVLVAPNLHWVDTDLSGLRDRLVDRGIGFEVGNEADLAALGELRHGAGRDLTEFVYVSGGSGVGAAIVADGRLARGAHGFAGEVGHVLVDPAGRRCSCGARGCLETVVGAGRPATPAQAAAALAVALRSVVHVLDPEAIILGGTLAAGGAELAETVEQQLNAVTIGGRWRPCRVRSAVLGDDAALIGAATLFHDRTTADPTTIAPEPRREGTHDRPSHPAS